MSLWGGRERRFREEADPMGRIPHTILVGSTRLRAGTLAALVSPLPAPPAAGQGAQLYPGQQHPFGTLARAMALADMDGDGHLDLMGVAQTEPSGVLAISFGDGSGGFGGDWTTDTLASSGARPDAAADLNGDGAVDLALVETGSGLMRLWPGLGTGVFGPLEPFAGPTHVADLAAVDVDADGALDLVVLSETGLSVSRGTLTGELLAPTFLDTSAWGTAFVHGLFGGNVTGDGVADLVALSTDISGSVRLISLVAGGPGFAALDGAVVTLASFTPQESPVARLPRDLDGDGHQDLVVGRGNDAALRTALGTGACTFTPMGPNLSTGDVDEPDLLLTGDWNEDGLDDVLAVGTGPPGPVDPAAIAVMLSLGDGSLVHVGTRHIGGSPHQGAVRDVDGDGHLDWVFNDFVHTRILRGNGAGAFGIEHRLPGTLGLTPKLSVVGSLQPVSVNALQVVDGRGFAPVFHVFGLGHLGLPARGGVLVPTLDLLIGGLFLDDQGQGALPFALPLPGVPAGTQLYLQSWIVDPAGPVGFAATNGVKLCLP